MIQLDPDFVLILVISFLVISNLFVFKYGPVRTKIIYMIVSILLLGKFLASFDKTWSTLLMLVGAVFITYYVADKFQNLLRKF